MTNWIIKNSDSVANVAIITSQQGVPTEYGRDGTVALQATMNQAATAGKELVGVGYVDISSTITVPNNLRMRWISGSLRMNSASTSRMFDFDGTSNSRIEYVTIDGNKTVTPSSDLVRLNNATRCHMRGMTVTDAPGDNLGSILISGTTTYCEFEDNTLSNGEGSAFGMTGTGVKGNKFKGNRIADYTGFGIRVGDGANRNILEDNYTESNGIELIGVTQASWGNRIVNNHAEGCGDNGISLSGYQNVCTGNTSRYNMKAGIWAWGSFNTITGNACISNNRENLGNNWSGIGISSNFGGTGQFNTITGNTLDDDQTVPTQFNNVRIAGVSYTIWATAASVAAAQYNLAGLNIYYTVGGGTTGNTIPTHTSGAESDGGVTWVYIRSFIGVAQASDNKVGPNVEGRFATGGLSVFDTGNFVRNAYVDDRMRSFTVSGLPSAGISRKMIYISNPTGNKYGAISNGTSWYYLDGTLAT